MAKTMKATKKKSKPTKQTRSHVKNGHAYFKHTGGYHEITTAAVGQSPGTSVGD